MSTATPSRAETLVLHGISWDFYERFLEEAGDRSIRHTYDDGDFELPSPLLLHGVSWDFYEEFLEATQNQRVRHSYDDGELEIMSPMRMEHESPKKQLAQLVEALTEELGIPRKSAGSMTLRSRRKARGLEPDECYYIAHELQMRRKTSYDPHRDPAPDLAIEVDWTSSSLPRLPLYGKLGVAEVWRYERGRLTVLLLHPSGECVASEQSLAFPTLPLDEFRRFVTRDLDVDETTWIRSFRQWVRERLVPKS